MQEFVFKHKKKLSTPCVVKQWNRFSRESVESPFLEIFKPTWTWSSATCFSCPCFELGVRLDDLQVQDILQDKNLEKKISILLRKKLARVEWKFLLPLQLSMLAAKSWLRQMSFNNVASTLLSGRGTHV